MGELIQDMIELNNVAKFHQNRMKNERHKSNQVKC